jgi:hypothetical protein
VQLVRNATVDPSDDESAPRKDEDISIPVYQRAGMQKNAERDNGKNRKQRPITSIKKDLDYNERLWAVAEQYIPVAA